LIQQQRWLGQSIHRNGPRINWLRCTTNAGQRLFKISSSVNYRPHAVLDKQLQDTIYQFEHARAGQSRKSTVNQQQSKVRSSLAEALAEQTRNHHRQHPDLPALFDALDKYPKLASDAMRFIAVRPQLLADGLIG